jgi:serine/threonine protein kinase
LCKSHINNIDIKITDFGLAKAVNGNDDVLKTFCGTPQYFAPEVLKRRNTITGRGRYGKQADMWSVGVILYVLLSGTPPFDATGDSVAYIKQIDFPHEYWNSVSSDAKDLILKLLVKEPSKRYTIKDACNHKWIVTDDGDTHVHPLDDPQLLTMTGKLIPARVSLSNSAQRHSSTENAVNKRSTCQRTNTNPVSPDEEVKSDPETKLPDSSIRFANRHQMSPIFANNYSSVKSPKHIKDPTKALNDFTVGVFPRRKTVVATNAASEGQRLPYPKDVSRCGEGSDIKEQDNPRVEHSDDEIVSQFSEQTESISSFVSEPLLESRVDDSFAVATRLFQKISPLDATVNTSVGRKPVGKGTKRKRHAAVSSDHKEDACDIAPVKKTRKPKKTNDEPEIPAKLPKPSSGNRKDGNQSCGKGKQTTLSGWVTKSSATNNNPE